MKSLWVWDFSSCFFLDDEKKSSFFLGKEEKKRWMIIKSPLRKKQFLAGKILIKSILVSQWNKNRQIFSDNLNISHFEEVFFSLSHSDNFVLAGFSTWGVVGVDIEIARNERKWTNLEALAHRFFSPDEKKKLKAFPENEKTDYFYQIWTLKESLYKFYSNSNKEKIFNDKKSFFLNFYNCLKIPLSEIIPEITYFKGIERYKKAKKGHLGYKFEGCDKFYWAWISDKWSKPSLDFGLNFFEIDD